MTDNRAGADSLPFLIRRATSGDIPAIHRLLTGYAERGLLLPLSKEKVRAMLPAFLVAESCGMIVGCGALRDFDDDLYEVRSLAVDSSMGGRGIGSKLVAALVDEFKLPDGARLFALTYRVHFFCRMGFKPVDKRLFPQKIWSDCENCPKKEHCDENAVLAILPLKQNGKSVSERRKS